MGDRGSKPVDPLVEPLTRREREVLALLKEDMTVREIAAKLTIAASSAKWHVLQIYGKLGVNSRQQAIARARELGLLVDSRTQVSQPVPKHNLPRPLTSFIGREVEITQIKSLLEEHALVTLTGSGGVGKTRLALQVAQDVLERHPDGVWLVELAPLADPNLLSQAVAAALGVYESPGRPVSVALGEFLQAKHLLLILDNCEHLAAACAELAVSLLQGCPRLSILATSRERLGVPGEIVFPVPPLSNPSAHDRLDLESVGQYEAVRLFVERAQTASPAFTLTEENAQAIAQICQRLDGLPLAIELAAARLRLLSVGQIAARLNDVFRLLAGGSRTALPHHQTLRASIEWSYNLLDQQEQAMLQNLSAFAGGWTLEAAETICPEGDVLDGLGQLVNKSLVLVMPGKGETRYRMLETIHQYAGEKLAKAGGSEQARDRHLAYYLQLTEKVEPELRGRNQVARLDQLEEELDNLRAALAWALQTSPAAELRLAAGLMWFWHIRTQETEGLEWLERGLARVQAPDGPHIQPALRARALAAAGFLHDWDDSLTQAEIELEESLKISRELGPEGKAGAAFATRYLGDCIVNRGDSPHGIA